jgi:phosphatidylglycerol---prolipoprotein diacylglyceryl transferase
MLTHPQFNPVAFAIGPLSIRWYGLMYLVAFAATLWLGRVRLARADIAQSTGMKPPDMEDLVFYGALGVILGGRLGYVLFYKPGYYFNHPQEILSVWQGGLSFHGGLLGVLLCVFWYAHRRGRRFLAVTDLIAPTVPFGIAAVRLGNFINGELPGRPTDLPWGMIFPQLGDSVARHPSQLYQAAGEGLLLWVLLWLYSRKPRPVGAVSAMFLIGYAVLRFIAEFAREPDSFLGLLALNMSMGQWLCVPMLLVGVFILIRAHHSAALEPGRG